MSYRGGVWSRCCYYKDRRERAAPAARVKDINSKKPVSNRGRCALAGLGCAALVLCWQWLTVHSNYVSRWTALFCTGGELQQPPDLAAEHIYLFSGSKGYDGQMYHYIAHDPFFRRGFETYLDAPRMRYRRILVPLAAHLLAFGRDDRVDAAFFGIVLLAIFLGGYWLSRYCSLLGLGAAGGLAFALIPASLISMDRMTVDVALAALCVAFALFNACDAPWALYAVLTATPLIRETGFLLTAAYVTWLITQRKFSRAVLFSTTTIPALIWYGFVLLNTEPEGFQGLSRIPFQGIAERIATPYHYQFSALINAASTVLDYVALAGIMLGVGLALRMIWRREWGPVQAAACLFALLAAFLYSPGAWTEVYAFGRTLSPLLVLLALAGLSHRDWLRLLPLAFVIPRTAIQMAPQLSGVVRHLL